MDWCLAHELNLLQLEKPHKTGLLTAYLKGAPERVLAKCSTYLKDGKEVPITDDFKAAYDEAYDVRASQPLDHR